MSKMHHLTEAYISLHTKLKKGTCTHNKEIWAFQHYFEAVYNPSDHSRTISKAAPTLKEKLIEKITKLKFPSYVKDKYLSTLFFHKPKFPPFPYCELDLSFFSPFPRWFVCGHVLSDIENACKKHAQIMVSTKHDAYSYRGHLHVDIGDIRVLSNITDGDT